MSAVNSHLFELQANIQNDNEESVEFRVNVSSDEYTAFGWNKTDGYYFDRTHTNRAGINFVNVAALTAFKANIAHLSMHGICT